MKDKHILSNLGILFLKGVSSYEYIATKTTKGFVVSKSDIHDALSKKKEQKTPHLKLDTVPSWAASCCWGRYLILQNTTESHPLGNFSPLKLLYMGNTHWHLNMCWQEKAMSEKAWRDRHCSNSQEEKKALSLLTRLFWLYTHLCSSWRLCWAAWCGYIMRITSFPQGCL